MLTNLQISIDEQVVVFSTVFKSNNSKYIQDICFVFVQQVGLKQIAVKQTFFLSAAIFVER